MLRRRHLGQARLLAARLHAEERDERAHLLLHRLEAGQRVELGQQLLERARLLFLAQDLEVELLPDLRPQLVAERFQGVEWTGHSPTVPITVPRDAWTDDLDGAAALRGHDRPGLPRLPAGGQPDRDGQPRPPRSRRRGRRGGLPRGRPDGRRPVRGQPRLRRKDRQRVEGGARAPGAVAGRAVEGDGQRRGRDRAGDGRVRAGRARAALARARGRSTPAAAHGTSRASGAKGGCAGRSARGRPTSGRAASIPELEPQKAQRKLAQDILSFCRLGPRTLPATRAGRSTSRRCAGARRG